MTKRELEIDVIDRTGVTPLHVAAARGNVGCINLLLEQGSKAAFIPNEDGLLPIHVTCAFGRLEAFKLFNSIEEMSPYISSGKKQLAPIHVAAAFSSEILKFIMTPTADTDPNYKGLDGVTPLYLAAS